MEHLEPTFIFLVLEGWLYLLVAGIVLKNGDPRDGTVRLLIFYVVFSLLWLVGQISALLGWLGWMPSLPLSPLLAFGLLILALMFLQLSRTVLRLSGTGWAWWALGGAWAVAAVLLGSEWLPLPGVLLTAGDWSVSRQALAWGALPAVGWGLFTAVATVLTVRTRRRAIQPLHRNRIAYWAAALILSVLGAALLLAGQQVPGNAFFVLGVLVAAYVLSNYHLLDIRQVARRVTSYLIVALISAVLYTALFLLLVHVMEVMPRYSVLLAGLTLAVALVVLVDPLMRGVRQGIDRLLAGVGYDPSRTLREYGVSISNILDLERLATVIVGLISEAMEIRRGALFIVHPLAADDETAFRLQQVGGMGEDLSPAILSVGNPVTDYLRQERQPLNQYDIDMLPRFRDVPAAEREWLSGLDMDIYVPIYAKEEWVGFLALGPKRSGDRYFESDLTLLCTLADQTAVALQNARLYDDLKARNVEIELLNVQLQGANRELARLEKAKSDFIGIASHELRTPLTHIRGCNDILGSMIRDGTLQAATGVELTEGVNKSVNLLQEIVNTMFDVSRIDTASLTLHPIPTVIKATVNVALENLAPALEKRKQTVKLCDLDRLPTIIADNKRLEQVLIHLIQNAIKFTPDGGEIRISGRWLDGDRPAQDQQVEIIVADSGIGIAEEDLERIFDKFFRVGELLLHSTDKVKFKGAGPGLGLTVARGIVEAHGGRIWAESAGHDEDTLPGSEFHVVLPLQMRRTDYDGTQVLIAAMRHEPND